MDGDPQPQLGSSDSGARQSRACEHCSRIKAKCVPQAPGSSSDQSQCARCFRLQRPCVIPPRAARKKRAANINPVAKLEQKIESLVTLIAAAQVPSSIPQASSPGVLEAEPHVDLTKDASWHVSTPNRQLSGYSNRATNPSLDANPVGTQGFRDLNDFSRPIGVLDHDGVPGIFLQRFGDQIPFVAFSPKARVQKLRDDHPWLYRAILLLTLEDLNHQAEMGEKIATDIAAAMLLKGDKSLDMLQCLLIYNAWYYYFTSVSPYQHSYASLQLAMAMLVDLNLNKPVSSDEGAPHQMLSDPASRRIWSLPSNNNKRTLAEHRAFLYCFYLANSIAAFFRRIDGMKSSPYTEVCCQILAAAAEYEADLVLVAAVRLQIIIEPLNHYVQSGISGPNGPSAPIWMHVASLRAQVQGVLRALPVNLQNHTLIRVNNHVAEIALYEFSISESLFGPTFKTQRLDMLYACLNACKATLDLFAAMSGETYRSITVTNLGHLGHALSTLFKLSMVNEPGWDLSHVRTTVDLSAYFDHFISTMDQVGLAMTAAQTQPCRKPFPVGSAAAMRRVKNWYESMIAEDMQHPEADAQMNNTGMDGNFGSYNLDYLDEAFWQQALADDFLPQ